MNTEEKLIKLKGKDELFFVINVFRKKDDILKIAMTILYIPLNEGFTISQNHFHKRMLLGK